MNLKYMKLKEIVNLYCDHGKHVVISNGEQYILISPFKDRDGNYRSSGIEDTLDKIFNYVGYINVWVKEQFFSLEKDGWKYHSIWTPPDPKPFEINQLVDILENCVESVDYNFWPIYAKDMVGKKGLRVTLVTNDHKGINYSIWDENDGNCWCFSHKYLAPHIPEEQQKQNIDVLIKDGKKYKVQIIEEIK